MDNLPTAPAPEPARHSIADVLRLVAAIRHIAYHGMDDPAEQMRGIRDLFLEHDHPEAAGDA